MVKLFKSALLWQLLGGFALGTLGMIAINPANASESPVQLIAGAAQAR